MVLQCNSTIDFDHFDIFATDVSKFNILVKESLSFSIIGSYFYIKFYYY